MTIKRKEEVFETTADEINNSVSESIISAGIGVRYASKERSLTAHGESGKALSEEFANGNIVDLARAGYGIYILGDGLKAYDLMMLVCRAFVLKGIPTRVCSLSYIEHLVNGGDDWKDVMHSQVLGVTGWQEADGNRSPMSPEMRFRCDMFFRRVLENNRSLVLQSPVVPEEAIWWTKVVREFVTDKTAVYPSK